MKAAKAKASTPNMPGAKTADGVNDAPLRPVRTALDDDRDHQQGQDRGLGDQQHPEQPGADVDAAAADEPDQHDRHEHEQPPRQVDAR